MESSNHLPFPLWDEPECGYIPLVSNDFWNSLSENKVFGKDDLAWDDVSIGINFWKQKEKLLNDAKESIERSYDAVKEEIAEFLGENVSSPIEEHIPKTPHAKAKTRSRRGITKKRSSISQTVRRSSRRTKQSFVAMETISVDRMSLSTEANSLVQSIVNSTPARGRRGRKKKQTESVTSENSSPVVELSDCQNFVRPTPKMKVTKKLSVRCKRSVLLHEDGTFDVIPAHNNKRSRKNSEKPQPVKPKPIKKSRKQSQQPEVPDVEPEPVNDVFEESENTEIPKTPKISENSPVAVVVLTPIKQGAPANMDVADVVVMETPVAEESNVKEEHASCMETDGDADTTSSSVCSSSAATVVLEDNSHTLMNPTVDLLETSEMIFAIPDSDEEEDNATTKNKVKDTEVAKEEVALQNSRKSVRISRKSSRVLGGFAAKRRSTRQSLRNRTLQVAQIDIEETSQPPPVEEAETENEETTEEHHMDVDSHEEHNEKENSEPASASKRPRPKIAKPVVRTKIKKPPPSVRSGSLKRTRAKIGAAISASNSSLLKTPSPPKHKRAKTTNSASKLDRSTEASRAKRTPVRASPANARFVSGMPNLQFANFNTTLKSFIIRNTPEKVNKQAELEAKKKMLEEKTRKDEERQKLMEEQKQVKLLEQKRKREERAKRANQLREERERAEREKQDKLQDRWAQKIADADRCKNLRKVEEVVKMQNIMEKMAKAEAKRREEETEKLARLKEQEEEREKRLRQHRKEKKLQEEQRLKEKKLEEQREEQRRLEEERIQQQKVEEHQHRAAEEEERLRRKREQEEQDRSRRKRELEAAMEIAAKKKKQEDMKKLADQREEARKEREAARHKRMEEKRLLKEEEKRQKEEQKRIKEAEKRAREEEKRRQEEELMQHQEEERREEAQRFAQQKLEAEKEARKEAARQKKELLRQKVEAERRIREEEEKQRRLREEQERRLMLQKEKAEMQQKMKEAAKQQLNSTYSKTAHTSALLEDSHDNYNMTPRGPGRPLLPSTNTDYVIEDLKSDDSTDNEDEPKKPIPTWAKGSALNFALIQQHHNSLSMADYVFHGLLEPVSLTDLFPNKFKARYFKRTSSAHWTSPIRPPGYTSFTAQCKGF